MKIFILISENIFTGEKIIDGAYTSEDKVLELLNTKNVPCWEYTYEEIELE